eukprot:TRINITY_DN64285_c0_g1_i1.p1 TRINITY_DN64285_c0_g1~~TRINITY_DN64285_c0_g1_i1.p1  ORF type:complete len:334 (-),score=46.32 TRINITY_DN64285_c0_g1_i1:36-1037(-)
MQVGLGVKMAAQGCSYWHANAWFAGMDCKLTALICLLLSLVLMQRTRLPTALIIFSIGLSLTIVSILESGSRLEVAALKFDVIWPSADEWLDGFLRGALPQLPLTTLNSVVSVCALSVSLFGKPDRGGKGASCSSVAASVGLMNVIGCWFGGMPSCHGAGGLAGQYKFGARGGMSVLMLGLVKIALALSLGQTLDTLISAYPKTILGVLLLFAGVELASVGARSLLTSSSAEADLMPCFITAGAYIGTKNMALGVSAGVVAVAIQRLEARTHLLQWLLAPNLKSAVSEDMIESALAETKAVSASAGTSSESGSSRTPSSVPMVVGSRSCLCTA